MQLVAILHGKYSDLLYCYSDRVGSNKLGKLDT